MACGGNPRHAAVEHLAEPDVPARVRAGDRPEELTTSGGALVAVGCAGQGTRTRRGPRESTASLRDRGVGTPQTAALRTERHSIAPLPPSKQRRSVSTRPRWAAEGTPTRRQSEATLGGEPTRVPASLQRRTDRESPWLHSETDPTEPCSADQRAHAFPVRRCR